MKQVQHGIHIGNASDARNKALISQSGIKAVVDLAIEEPPSTPLQDLISYRFPLHDGEGNSQAILQLAITSIHSLLVTGIPCLVACSAGVSRSPLIVAAAMSQYQNESIQDVLHRIALFHSLDVSPILFKDVSMAVDAIKPLSHPKT